MQSAEVRCVCILLQLIIGSATLSTILAIYINVEKTADLRKVNGKLGKVIPNLFTIGALQSRQQWTPCSLVVWNLLCLINPWIITLFTSQSEIIHRRKTI